MSKESGLWSWLHKAQKAHPLKIDMRRVEDMMGAGFPDVDGFALIDDPDNIESLAFKLELKSTKRPARLSTPIRFALEKRDKQIEFMRKRYAMGENAYFLLQIGEGSDRRLYLAPGDLGSKLKTGILESELAVSCLSEGYIFPPHVLPLEIIKGIQKCCSRRAFR